MSEKQQAECEREKRGHIILGILGAVQGEELSLLRGLRGLVVDRVARVRVVVKHGLDKVRKEDGLVLDREHVDEAELGCDRAATSEGV